MTVINFILVAVSSKIILKSHHHLQALQTTMHGQSATQLQSIEHACAVITHGISLHFVRAIRALGYIAPWHPCLLVQ